MINKVVDKERTLDVCISFFVKCNKKPQRNYETHITVEG